MREISADARLRNFISKGFFPLEVPPPFTSEPLADQRKAVLQAFPPPKKLEQYRTQYDPYSLPRINANRRRLAIVNPIPFVCLANVIARNWPEIKKHLTKSTISVFKPIFDLAGPRTFFGVDFDAVRSREHEILGRFNSCLRTDISRFYPTIYTHSIGWALRGKAYCKAHLHTKQFNNTFANKIDVFLRNMQDGQTLGIPVGPETSKVIAEIISSAIDVHLQNDLKLSPANAFRLVDDHTIAIRSDLNETSITHAFSKWLSEYELESNFSKTRQIGVRGINDPSWTEEIASFRIVGTGDYQRKRLDQYFEKVFHIAGQFESENVLRYGVSRSRSFIVGDDNWPHFQLLLQAAVRRSDGGVLRDYCQLVVNANFNAKPIDRAEAALFIEDLITTNAQVANTHEVAWALFLAKALRIKVTSSSADLVLAMDNSICLLLLVDLFNRQLVDMKITAAHWKGHFNSDGLRSPLWLFLYELHKNQWLGVSSIGSFVEADPLFGSLLNNGVYFYEEDKNVPKFAIQVRSRKNQNARIKFVFHHMDEYF